MRRAPIPHTACGSARVCSRRDGWLRLVRALVLLATAAVALTLLTPPSTAQDPSLYSGIAGNKSSFAKKKGGIGQHVTAMTPREFAPNLRTKRVWVPELKKFVTVKLTARALKTLNKNGAYSTLKKAGIVA